MTTWFTRLRSWVSDDNNGIPIRSDYHDSEDDNFATGINNCLNIAGQNSPTSNISWGSNKITSLAAGTASTDAANVNQVQTRTVAYATDSSGTNAYAITLSPALTSYAAGQMFHFSPGTANTGAATLNINGLGAKTIKKDKTVDLVANDFVANQIVCVAYDGTNFQLISPPVGLLNQTSSAIYAADGGASSSYAITLSPAPASYVTGMVVYFKPNTTNNGAATLNLNSLGAKTIKKDQGADLAANDLKANQIAQVIYDGTNFQLLSPIYGTLGQNGGAIYAADTGSANAYVVTLSPAPIAYVAGMVVRFKASFQNTGSATLNVNSLGAITLKKSVSTNLASADIAVGQLVEAVYDGTNFQVISPITNAAGTVTSIATGNGLTGGTITTSGTLSFASATTVQTVTTSSQTPTSSATTIPADNTIPQNTEGTQLITLAITPKSASSILIIDFLCPLVGSSAGGTTMGFALFQDSTANALNAGTVVPDSTSRGMSFSLRHVMTSGTTSSTTFKIRYGPGSGTQYILRSSDNTLTYGAVPQYTLVISEVLP